MLLLTTLGSAQQKIRFVDETAPFPHQPIEIVSKELGDQPFIDNGQVYGDQDWLSQLTLSVKNISNRNIRYFHVDLLVKKNGRILMGIPIYFYSFMKSTDSDVPASDGEKAIKDLPPGAIVKVKVSDRTMELYRKELIKNEVENIDRVTIEIREVGFDDKTRWMFGRESRPDPNNPGKRIRIDNPD